MADRASHGLLVYDLNFTIITGTAEWNVDLVLGAPSLDSDAPDVGVPIIRSRPSTVQIAIEHKAVMTEHRKAIKNRKRDFEAHHDHVHRYSAQAIAAGTLVVNMARQFQSTLRAAPTTHSNPTGLVSHCVNEMRAVAARSTPQGEGLDAKAVIVVDFDNLDWNTGRYVVNPPAPQVGDQLHYDAFIQAICARYSTTFT